MFRSPSHLLVVFTPSSCRECCALLWLKQCFAKGFVELRTVVRSFSALMITDDHLCTWGLEFCGFATFLNFSPSTTPIHCKSMCGASRLEKCATLPRVFAFDLQSLGRVARHTENVSFYDAFSRSTGPIHCKNRVGTQSCNFTSRSVPHRQSIVKIDASCLTVGKCAILPRFLTLTYRIPGKGCALRPTMCHFETRSVAFSPSTRPIHCKNRGAERLEKMCNFASRSVPRPCQSIVKIDASRLTLGKCATLPRVRSLDHANPL